MAHFIGILELILWIVLVIALAAGITYAVVRFTPKRAADESQPTSASDAS